MAFTVARAAGSGFAAGLCVILGALLGKLALLALAWTLITGTLSLSTDLLAALKTAGVATLCLLALALLSKPARPNLSNALPCPSRAGLIGDIAGGFAANATSPVNLVVLVVLVPQVVDPRATTPAELSVVVASLLAITAAPLIVVAALAARNIGRVPCDSIGLARVGAAALIIFAAIAALTPSNSAVIGAKAKTTITLNRPTAQPRSCVQFTSPQARIQDAPAKSLEPPRDAVRRWRD